MKGLKHALTSHCDLYFLSITEFLVHLCSVAEPADFFPVPVPQSEIFFSVSVPAPVPAPAPVLVPVPSRYFKISKK